MPTPSIARGVLFAALVQILASCSSEASLDPDAPTSAPTSAPSSTPLTTPAGTPEATPSATPTPVAAQPTADAESQAAMPTTSDGEKGPNFPGQRGWLREEPENEMRMAQFSLPMQAGDGEDAQLVVFSFGGPAGDVDSNLQRWVRMMEQPDGSDSSVAAQRTQTERDGMIFHTVDISGRFVAPAMPGSGDAANKPGWRLIGTVIEASDRAYYVKLTGPQGTVGHWRASYAAFLDQVDPPH